MSPDEPISREDVAGIAEYARIALTEDELDEMCAYLRDAVALLEPIRHYDLKGVEPTFHPIDGMTNVVREDVVVAGLSLEEALANAGATRGRSFRVPAILGDGGAA